MHEIVGLEYIEIRTLTIHQSINTNYELTHITTYN